MIDSSWYFKWISEQMGKSQVYAQSAFTTAKDYLGNLNAFIAGTIDITPPVISIDPPGSIIIDPIIMTQLPAAPSNSEYPAEPGDAPTFFDHAFPADPSFAFPTVPTVHDITIPGFISNEIAGITATLPIFNDTVPTVGTIDAGGDTVHDSLMQAAKSKLESNILNGGTMLNPVVEADIWNRDQERRAQALQDAIDKIAAQWAKLGWSLPDGLLSGQLAALNIEYMNKDIDRSRDIAVEQAKMEQTGMFKSLELGIGLENIIMDSNNKYAQRVLEASKSTADVTIAIFRERVNRYNAMLAAYKTDVEAFKLRIDAEVSRAQAYETQLKALAMVNQIDETKVKIYTAQIAGISAMVDVYKNQVQAVGMMYEAEKVKIERYKVQVETYTTQVDAITKKYATEVEGFKAFVAGYSASSDSQTKLADLRGRAQIASAEATIKEWEIQLDLVTKNLTVRLEALKALASVSSNVAAGALSANHAGMNASIQGAAQLSYN